MDNMADGNFIIIINQKLPGKKSGSEHDDRNDRIVFPPRSAPDLGSLLYLTSLKLIGLKLKPRKSKAYPKYWPTKTEPSGSTSISLYLYVITAP